MKTIISMAVAVLIITACQEKKETATQNLERDSLISVINQRDASINDFLAVNNEIEQNLDSIASREGAISKNMMKETELKSSQKDRINDDISAINDLMKKNRIKIDEFNQKLKSSNSQNAEYQKMVEHLNTRIAGKDNELMALNDKLITANIKVTNLQTSVNYLSAQNNMQAQKIQQQKAELHTAYFVVGQSKDLRDKKIINKTGGLLGIGRTSQIEPNIDNSNFQRIDYTMMNSIEINSKDARIITSHPDDSYSFEKDANKKITNLKITNPDKFWSASKYLVVIKD